MFEELIKSLDIDLSAFLVPDPSDWQKKIIEDATFILKDNIIDDVVKFGMSVKQNEDKLKEVLEKGDKLIKEDEKYKDVRKDLQKIWKDYAKKLREYITKCCVAKIPVKEMPWEDVMFRTHPRLEVEKKKVKLHDNPIAYYGEIKCVIARTTVYGKMKSAEPLFAPHMGELDLGGFELDEDQKKGQKPMIYSYISAIIESLDTPDVRVQLAKYNEGYQRHGDPVCDFLMKNEELMTAMKKLVSGIDSGRLGVEISVCGIAIPMKKDKRTIVLTIDEGKESDSDRYARCFEALLRLSAACCEAPSTKSANELEAEEKAKAAQAQAGPSGPGTGGLVAPTQAPQQQAQPGGQVAGPGGQNLNVWTPEQLAEEAQKRGSGGVPSGMSTWSEEDLEKMAQERGSGIPEGMEVWSEEDLEELKKKRQGGAMDIPEWTDDGSMKECANCGYALRPGWRECPVCNTPVGPKSAPKAAAKSAPKDAAKSAPKSAPKEAAKAAPKDAPRSSPEE